MIILPCQACKRHAPHQYLGVQDLTGGRAVELWTCCACKSTRSFPVGTLAAEQSRAAASLAMAVQETRA